MLKPRFNNHKQRDNENQQSNQFKFVSHRSHSYRTNRSHDYHEESNKQIKSCCLNNTNKNNIVWQEFLCHLPMSILALSISLLCLTFFDNLITCSFPAFIKKIIYMNFFHIAHYIHILCASFGSFYLCCNINNSSYKKIILIIVFSFLNSLIFCTLADIILPALGSLLLDESIKIHMCFLHTHDIWNAVIFSLFGIFAAFCLQYGEREYGNKIAKKVHLGHVWFGCIASLLYILSEINIDIMKSISILFIILFFSVIIPCVFADICLPFLFGNNKIKNEYHNKKINYHN